MSILRFITIVGVFAFGVFVGYTVNRVEFEHNDCDDFSGKYQHYEAWLSIKNGVYRCFWIEKEYPWRVRVQGVIDVK
jgi:hypothetical protein